MPHNLEITADLKEWWINPFYNVYWGRLYGDIKGRWPDGTHIHTSHVIKADEKDDCFIVTTRNSIYRLMKCDEKRVNDNEEPRTRSMSL